MLDAIIPIVPSETAVVTAGALSASGDLHLPRDHPPRRGRRDRGRQHRVPDRPLLQGLRARPAVSRLQEAPPRQGAAGAARARWIPDHHRTLHSGGTDRGRLRVGCSPLSVAAVSPLGHRGRAPLGDVLGDDRLRGRGPRSRTIRSTGSCSPSASRSRSPVPSRASAGGSGGDARGRAARPIPPWRRRMRPPRLEGRQRWGSRLISRRWPGSAGRVTGSRATRGRLSWRRRARGSAASSRRSGSRP